MAADAVLSSIVAVRVMAIKTTDPFVDAARGAVIGRSSGVERVGRMALHADPLTHVR